MSGFRQGHVLEVISGALGVRALRGHTPDLMARDAPDEVGRLTHVAEDRDQARRRGPSVRRVPASHSRLTVRRRRQRDGMLGLAGVQAYPRGHGAPERDDGGFATLITRVLRFSL